MQLLDFLGQWRFSRVIYDAQGRESGRVSGVASIVGDAGSARYDEQGLMELPGTASLRAQRVYLWRSVAAGIAVQFDDGRAFHTIDLQDVAATAKHWCDPDDYHAAYDFSAWPVWTSDWRVKGPRKAYRMVTRYERA
ncbi:MAG: DUF6314 family protein [Deltaproteobacteria bacterium]